jgi:hypothetical protein
MPDTDYDGNTITVEDTPEDVTFVPAEDADVDYDGDTEDDEVEDVSGATTTEDKPKAAKTVKEPARGELPDGYVTPVGLAHKLNEEKLGKTDEEGNYVNIPPQQVYSYIRNAPKGHPFPLETVQDSIGKQRQAVKIEDGLQWWRDKNTRAAERRQNAAAKAKAKVEKAAATSETPAESANDAGPVEEAE